MNFKKFKAEILLRAKKSGACNGEYQRAKSSKNFSELIKVITDNFNYSCSNNIIDTDLLLKVGAEICNKSNLYFNQNTSSGYLLASDSATVRASGSTTVIASGSATVEASGSTTVIAFGSTTVRAFGSTTVRAFGSATVRAFDSATVEAFGSAYVCSFSSIEHKVSDRSILRYIYTNKVILADIESLKS